MRNDLPKFILLAGIIVVVAVSVVVRPSLFISSRASTANAGGVVGDASQTLPSLTANIGAQITAVVSSGSSIGSSDAGPAVDTNSGVDVDGMNAIVATSSIGSFARVNYTPVPNVGASAVLIADLDTGGAFLNINADERWPMASVSKLMTAVVATDLFDPNQRITITPEMTAADPTEHILNVGDTYTVEDLLHVMLLPSNNVAAESLAQFYGRAAFLAAMNAKAQAWGMTDTYYDDPSGLSAANESSAVDLLKLAQNIYTSYPQILAITRMPEATVFNIAINEPVTVKSINDFAGQADFIGGKTGYTDQADGNLLSIFNYEGRPIFIMVLGVDDGVRFDATQEVYNWFKTDFK